MQVIYSKGRKEGRGDNRKDKTRRYHRMTLLRIFRKYSEEPGAPREIAEFLRSLTFGRPRTIYTILSPT